MADWWAARRASTHAAKASGVSGARSGVVHGRADAWRAGAVVCSGKMESSKVSMLHGAPRAVEGAGGAQEVHPECVRVGQAEA